ncbi:hypothetical protein [Paenibacillus sp. YIM B09110]|uniref:hypothetical protein n=1 Tax=Paenibacillus sp. YIM B09110 TaxID=3126102 RepID=UPI00301D1FA5
MSFIKIYNYLLDNEANQKVEQIYLYAMLKADYSIFNGYTSTTITILAQGNVLSTTNTKRKVKLIKELLEQLQERKIIQIDYEGELGANTPIIIRFPDLGGHEQITPDMYSLASCPAEFFVLVTIKRFTGEPFNGFEKAKDRWSDILGYGSKNTGNKIINKLVEDKKIYCVEGERYRDNNGLIKQHSTKWFLNKHNQIMISDEKNEELISVAAENEEIKDISATSNAKDKITQKEKPKKHNPSVTNAKSIEWGNWNNLNLSAFIKDADIELYVLQMHIEEFISIANQKLNSIPDKARFNIMNKIKKSLIQKERKENKNAVVINGEAVSVDKSNIESYRQYLIDNLNSGCDGVEVLIFNYGENKKTTISLKRMAVSVGFEFMLSNEVIDFTVASYINVIKADKEFDSLIFNDTKGSIRNRFHIAC